MGNMKSCRSTVCLWKKIKCLELLEESGIYRQQKDRPKSRVRLLVIVDIEPRQPVRSLVIVDIEPRQPVR